MVMSLPWPWASPTVPRPGTVHSSERVWFQVTPAPARTLFRSAASLHASTFGYPSTWPTWLKDRHPTIVAILDASTTRWLAVQHGWSFDSELSRHERDRVRRVFGGMLASYRQRVQNHGTKNGAQASAQACFSLHHAPRSARRPRGCAVGIGPTSL